MLKLQRKTDWYRPWFIDDRAIYSITFFNANGIIYKTPCGWLQENGKTDIDFIEIKQPIKKRKVDFTCKKNFIVTYDDYGGKKYNLFIYVDNVNVCVEKINTKTTTETSLKIHEQERIETQFMITINNKKLLALILNL